MTAPRVIAVHLTAHAPGCADRSLNDRRRNRDFYGHTLDQVVRKTLARLRRDPAQVEAAFYGEDPAIFGQVAGEPGPRPLAMIWEGATREGIAAAIAALRAAGWRPAQIDSPLSLSLPGVAA